MTTDHEADSKGNPAEIAAYFRLMMRALVHHKRAVSLQILLAVLLALIPPAEVVVTRQMINAVAAVLMSGGAMAIVVAYTCLEFILNAASASIGQLKTIRTTQLNEHLTYALKAPLVEKVDRLETDYVERPDYFDENRRAHMAVSRGATALESSLTLTQHVITLVSYAVIVSRAHWALAILLPAFALPNLILGSTLARRTLAISRRMSPLSRAVAYVEDLLTGRHAAKELRVFQLHTHLLAKFTSLYWQEAHERQAVVKAQSRSTLGLSLVQQAAGIGVTVFALWIAMRKGANLGEYVALVQAITGAQSAVQMISQKSVEFYGNALHMADYFSFLELPERGHDMEAASADALLPRIERIDVSNITFAYPDQRHVALENITFSLKRGEVVAIVGENGSGKTTLAKCLIGLCRPHKGSISFNGVDISTLPRESLYSQIGALFQDFVHYPFSARENIGFGDVARIEDTQGVWAAAAAAQIDGVLRDLPDGLDTELGLMFGPGAQLSLGQWQRLALSRVFFRESQIILLDEPSASLDVQSEVLLFRRVKEIYQGRKTVFLISHRLSVCREVDRILVLKGGRLVEGGDHDSLITAGGEYARLYALQARLEHPMRENQSVSGSA